MSQRDDIVFGGQLYCQDVWLTKPDNFDYKSCIVRMRGSQNDCRTCRKRSAE